MRPGDALMPPRGGGAAAFAASDVRSSGRSLLEPEVSLADPHDIAGHQPPLAREADAVHEGPVGRAGILDVDAVAARLEARVAGRGEGVAVDRDVVRAAAADRQRRLVDREDGA